MAEQSNPLRYAPLEWFSDFGAYQRSPLAQSGGRNAGEWSVLHFATKYFPESEARFRQVRWETAVSWLGENIEPISEAIGAKSGPTTGLVVNAAVLRVLYTMFAVDHGVWPIPAVPIEGVLELIRKQMQAEKDRPEMFG